MGKEFFQGASMHEKIKYLTPKSTEKVLLKLRTYTQALTHLLFLHSANGPLQEPMARRNMMICWTSTRDYEVIKTRL